MATAALFETQFSTLLRSSGAILQEVEHRDVLLHRRDGEDLMLVRADREATLRDSFATAARMLARLPDDVVLQLAEAIADELPWTRFLPREDQLRFLREFVEVARACDEVGAYEPLSQCVREWENTALVHANPALREVIHAEHEIDEPVPRPA
jgi:hypothetical protein